MEKELRNWFLQMGYPIDLLPDESTFQKVCRGQMSNIWEDVMKKTKPRQYVRQVRLNLLLNKIQNKHTYQEYENANEVNKSNFASNQIYLWNRKKRLEESILELDENISDVEKELDFSKHKMKVKYASIQRPLEKTLEQTKKYVSLFEEKYTQLNNELSECNNKYESAKQLNLVRNDLCNFNEKIFKKIENIVDENNSLVCSRKKTVDNKSGTKFTLGNSTFNTQPKSIFLIPDFPEKDSEVNEEYRKNFSSNNVQFWETIMQSKIKTIQHLKTLTENINDSKVNNYIVPNDLANICSEYNNYKLEHIYLSSVVKNCEAKVQSLLDMLSASNCIWTQKYLTKVGYVAAINFLKTEIDRLKKVSENKKLDFNSIIQETKNLHEEIDREKEFIESKLSKYNDYHEKLLNLPKIFQRVVWKVLFDTKDLQKKYFATTEDFSGEIALVAKSPEAYLANDLSNRAIEHINSSTIPVKLLVKIIENPEQCPISTVLNFFQQKLIMDIMNKWNTQDFKALEEINLNKYLNDDNSDINKQKREQLLEHLEAIRKECVIESLLQGKVDELLEFWVNQPMKRAISETRLFNGQPFSYYEKKYDSFYNDL